MKNKTSIARNQTAWSPGILYGLLVLVIFVLYARTLAFDFTNFDDRALILDNREFLSSFGNIFKAFGQNVFAMLKGSGDTFYRPMLMVTFITEYQIGGESAWIYHLGNILMHIIAATLLLKFLLLKKTRIDLAFMLSVLFAVHPAIVQNVAWIPGCNDTLLSIFAIAALIMLTKYSASGQKKHLLLHFIFVLFALLTKETAVFLPVLFALYILLVGKKKLPALLLPSIGWMIAFIIYAFMRQSALAGQPSVPLGQIAGQIFGTIPAILIYIGKLLLPVGLAIYPTMEDSSLVPGLAVLVIIAFTIWKFRNNNSSKLIFWCAWIIILLVPALLKTGDGHELAFLEQRIYLPMIGFFMLIAELVSAQPGWMKEDRKMVRVMMVPILLCAAISFYRSSSYATEERMWTDATEQSPNASYCWTNLGIWNQVNNNTDEARKNYEEAIRLNPDAHTVYNNLGRIYQNEGRLDDAERMYRRELSMHDDLTCMENLGAILIGKDSLVEAELWLNKALKIWPEYADAKNDLAAIYGKRGDYKMAVTLWEETVQLNPDLISAYKNLVFGYALMHDLQKAEEWRSKLAAKGVNVEVPKVDSAK